MGLLVAVPSATFFGFANALVWPKANPLCLLGVRMVRQRSQLKTKKVFVCSKENLTLASSSSVTL